MPRSKQKATVQPTQPGEIERFDEANSARLGLICVQERIPSDYTRWDQEWTVEGRTARLTCISPSEYGGVPHGLDGDFATTLNLMYLEQGAPESGEVNTTAYQLLSKSGFPDSGQYYQALQESLDRLKGATYTASESWRDKRYDRWTTVKFNIIEQIDADTAAGMAFGSGTILKIRLARPVVQSLRAQYVKPLDMTFVQSLNRALTRSLYRILDARRYDPVHLNEPVTTLRLPLQQWARECKLLESMPARIKRNLDSAHQELIDRGYLRTVTYEGTRANTIIVYEFGDIQINPPAPEPSLQVIADPPLVEALCREGVVPPVARKLVQHFGDVQVTARLETFHALLRDGYTPKKRSALLVDVIKDDSGKYAGVATPTRTAPTAAPGREAPLPSPADDTQEADELTDRMHAAFLALPREEQAARAVTQVRMFVGRELRETHLRGLLAAMLAGETDPYAVQREVIRAASELRLPEFAQQLRDAYDS
ncbi:replication initiator protein A (plasmid) [Deinococcus taeanensis]|uniref:replication initiator protein A n=1 Tax=Deinococcus taeanensis TaxID=2737050 RepID=UPI001CDB8BF8|nr:replication initiator protein A [Deinococcus taeanensis]UBV45377.1 replication initiator protein A [Deinococcus taeanensis]